MNKSITLLVLISLLSTAWINAQTPAALCGSADYLTELDMQYPGLKSQVDEVTNHANYRTRSGTITIPIVFHVVYNTATENLADAYLNAQVDLLNQTFARTNSDTSNLRSIFHSRVGPSKIRFIIDQIVRASTTNTSFDASSTTGFANSDIVKQSGSGGSDCIYPDRKLNIWICDLTKDGSNTLIGYAYPPAGAPNWSSGSGAPGLQFDGIVIDYTAVGGPAKQPLGYSTGMRGKSLVHEVGHYLGLRHIWGDDGGACQGAVGFKDDGINDTPVVADASAFNCSKTKNSCIETTGDLFDMVENYMDYSNETCQNSFTLMQISAMEYVIDNLRTLVRVPTAVNEQEELASKITIYPNPVSDLLHVDVNRATFGTASVIIINQYAQVVYRQTISKPEEKVEIQTANLPKGIYMVNVQFDNNPGVMTKIIVQ